VKSVQRSAQPAGGSDESSTRMSTEWPHPKAPAVQAG
jgi:hypothetical protein